MLKYLIRTNKIYAMYKTVGPLANKSPAQVPKLGPWQSPPAQLGTWAGLLFAKSPTSVHWAAQSPFGPWAFSVGRGRAKPRWVCLISAMAAVAFSGDRAHM